MTAMYSAVGLALLVLCAGLLYAGLPTRDGRVKAFATAELYTFAILISLTTGSAFLLYAVLG